ncbi:MAG: hypothetical protein EA402_05720 [Planctomycetota bacterium]|nr:MAG: hypothetical protein EA402_05720 [Planctomycetota bacterium]
MLSRIAGWSKDLGSRRGLFLTAALSAVYLFGSTGLSSPLQAAEGLTYEQEIATLRAMVDEPRDTEIYELDFRPINFDRILVRDRLGENQVFHYLRFRLRNRVSASAEYLSEHATVYNEILDNMVREYDFLRKDTEGGASLVMDAEALEDRRMAVILERQALRVRTRQVSLTVIGTNEHGTRFRLFDVEPGTGPQEAFNFPDRSLSVSNGNFSQRIREAIEERYRQRLYTTREIRELEIPPYDANRPTTFEDGYGMAQGEIFGVIIFDRLNDHGNHFTFEFQGLSNKQRFNWPERLPQGRVEDYFNLRVLRRTYVVELSRRGDEFNLDRKPFEMGFTGWRWIERFMRLEQRRAIAYSRYHRHNIRLPEETTRQASFATVDRQGNATQGNTSVAVLHDASVASNFWTHYNRIRSTWRQRYDARIAEHAAHGQRVVAPYAPPADPQRVTADEIQRRADELAAWQGVLERHQARLRERQQELDRSLPDWQSTTQERRTP